MLCEHCGNTMPLGQRVCATCGKADDLVSAPDGPATFTIVEQTEFHVAGREAWATPEHATIRQAAASQPVSRPLLQPHGPSPTATRASPVDTGRLPIPPREPEPERWTTLLGVLACVAGLATIATAVVRILSIRSDAAIPQYLGDYTISDLDGVGTNFQTAWIVPGALMLIGGLLVVQRTAVRFGAGLAGGAGLAVVPLAAFAATGTRSLADRALQQAQYVSATGGGGTEFASTLTVGFFVLLAAAALGVATALAAFWFAHDDRRQPLSTVLGVMGALGCVLAGAGQLLPEGDARFGDNFSNPYSVGAFVYSRLAMMLVVAVLGTFGFLRSSRFGLGVVFGAISVFVWQWSSSQFDVGNLPLPPAIFNPGGDSTPHMVTTIGVIAAVVCAAGQTVRARRMSTS